jgi:hypothetical protein
VFIFDAFGALDLLVGMAVTFGLLYLSTKIGLMKNWLDPMGPPLFQSFLTLVLLGGSIIPVGHVVMFSGMLLLVARLRPVRHVESRQETQFWERSLGTLLVLSVVANAFLVSQKGLVILSDDVAANRLEFYQGWGAFQRLNAATVVLFGVRWAKSLVSGHGREPKNILMLIWVIYLLLAGGSKAGLVLVLAYIGSALCFERRAVKISSFLPLVIVSLLSVLGMFYIFFGGGFLAQMAFRFVSFADGPFYYYNLPYAFRLPLDYPFEQLATTLRLQPGLTQPSLGTLINYWYFGYYNDLVGPNPQIFVESQAVAGALYPLYYLVVGLLISACMRWCRTPYSLALFAGFYGAILADAPYAFSNVVNIFVTIFLVASIGFAMKLIGRAQGSVYAT